MIPYKQGYMNVRIIVDWLSQAIVPMKVGTIETKDMDYTTVETYIVSENKLHLVRFHIGIEKVAARFYPFLETRVYDSGGSQLQRYLKLRFDKYSDFQRVVQYVMPHVLHSPKFEEWAQKVGESGKENTGQVFVYDRDSKPDFTKYTLFPWFIVKYVAKHNTRVNKDPLLRGKYEFYQPRAHIHCVFRSEDKAHYEIPEGFDWVREVIKEAELPLKSSGSKQTGFIKLKNMHAKILSPYSKKIPFFMEQTRAGDAVFVKPVSEVDAAGAYRINWVFRWNKNTMDVHIVWPPQKSADSKVFKVTPEVLLFPLFGFTVKSELPSFNRALLYEGVKQHVHSSPSPYYVAAFNGYLSSDLPSQVQVFLYFPVVYFSEDEVKAVLEQSGVEHIYRAGYMANALFHDKLPVIYKEGIGEFMVNLNLQLRHKTKDISTVFGDYRQFIYNVDDFLREAGVEFEEEKDERNDIEMEV